MSLKNKRALVTGAGGFLGRHLCQALYTQGVQVVGLVRRPGTHTPYLAEQHVGDIVDRLRVRQLVQEARPDLVVHLAAVKNRSRDLADYRAGYEVNVLGSLNLIEACQELSSLGRFVFLGTCEEYGHMRTPFEESLRESPVTAYAVTKLGVTQLLQTLVRARGFPAVILRPSVVYGPTQGSDMFLPALIEALVSRERFGMTPGGQTRDFLFVDDMVNAILLALSAADNVHGRVINISSALPIRIDELAKKVARLMGPEMEHLLDFNARDYRPGEAMNYWASNVRARELLGWSPRVSLEDGLRQTICFVRDSMAVG